MDISTPHDADAVIWHSYAFTREQFRYIEMLAERQACARLGKFDQAIDLTHDIRTLEEKLDLDGKPGAVCFAEMIHAALVSIDTSASWKTHSYAAR